MSVWTAPVTWVTGAVTAASMNAEIRDHANFLKGALDILTASTTADTGATMYLSFGRATGLRTFGTYVTADTGIRFEVTADGHLRWANGTATNDVRLYRAAAGSLFFDTNGASANTDITAQATVGFRASVAAQVNGDTFTRIAMFGDATLQGIEFGPGNTARDTNLYRAAGSVLATDDLFRVNSVSGIVMIGSGGTALRSFALVADANPLVQISNSGVMAWGAGGGSALDANLYRVSAGFLKSDDYLQVTNGLATKANAGVVSDASFAVTPVSGTIAIDTTNSRIYVRVGTVWKMVAVA